MSNCYYYDEQRDHCKCYVNENLNELLAENAKLRELLDYMTPIAWYASSERERDRMRELGVEATE